MSIENIVRILILEDDINHAQLAEIEIRGANVSFLSKLVDTKQDFIKELHDFAPDVILADYHLPNFNGLEALSIVKKESPDMPFILVTGEIGESNAIEILKSGATDYVLKNSLSRLPYAVLRAIQEAEEKRERKRTENALLNAAQQWRKTFDGISICISLLERDGKIRRCNIAMQKLLGKSFPEIIGKNLWDLLKCTQKLQQRCPIMHSQQTKEKQTLQCVLDNRSFNITVDPIVDKAGELDSVIHVMVDITEQKETEKRISLYQEQLQSLVSDLSLAEERQRRRITMDVDDYIGKTLTVAKIKLGSLQEATLSQEIKESLDEIHELIGQAIYHTRSLTSEYTFSIYKLELVTALKWVAEESQQNGIAVECEDDGQPKPINEEIRAILFKSVRELLFNVVKHARANKAKVITQRDGDKLRITVQDDGIGFEIAQRDSHRRVSSRLGLFSIREQLRPFGGHLDIRSGVEQGTRVTITLPLTSKKITVVETV